MEQKCYNCKYKITDKERDIVRNCDIAKIKKDPMILILGRKGICPYHEYPEYYGMK